MSAPQPASLWDEVNEIVRMAMVSDNRHQLIFAARRALNAFDLTHSLNFLTLYLDCQFKLNPNRGYQLFQDAIQRYKLRPDPHDRESINFFHLFAIRSTLMWSLLDQDPRSEIRVLIQPFLDNWKLTRKPEAFLLVLYERGEFELLETLAEQTQEWDAFTATLFFMHLAFARNNYLAAYNLFCELAAMCTEDGSAPELNSLQDLAELFELFHFRYGLNLYNLAAQKFAETPPTAQPTSLTQTELIWDSRSLRLGVNGVGLFRLIGVQLMLPDPLPETEMPLEMLLDVWQQHVQHLGPLNQEPDIAGNEVNYHPTQGIVVNGDHQF